MADDDKKKKVKTISLKDHPSLILMGELIKLRVFEDFFIDTELPKWKKFEADWSALKKQLGCRYDEDLERAVEKIVDDEERKRVKEKAKALKTKHEQVKDDRWHIREKHEREVRAARALYGSVIIEPSEAAAIKAAKDAKAAQPAPVAAPKKPTKKSLLKGLFSRKKKAEVTVAPVPTVAPAPAAPAEEVAFPKTEFAPIEVTLPELKTTLIHFSTKELAEQTLLLQTAEQRFRDAGQYPKAEMIHAHLEKLAEEQVIINAGFEYYLEEDQAIEFLKKSERGATIDFLRYYDELLPEDVVAKKKKADELMVFDNYVIAYYTDIGVLIENDKKKAAREKKDKQEKKAAEIRAKRRDPILFGIIKNSRKLFMICDWVIGDDDLTMEKLEKVINQKRKEIKNSPIAEVVTLDGEVDTLSADERKKIEDATKQLREAVSLANNNSSSTYYSESRANSFVINRDQTNQITQVFRVQEDQIRDNF